MKIQIYRNIVFLLLIHLLQSCSDEHEIGRLSVDGLKDVFINLSQENEFDSATAIYYEIVNSEGKVILRKYHLTGTHDYESDLRNFAANSQDSIIYLTYLDTNRVFAIYDLKSGKGYPQGSKNEGYEMTSKNGDTLFNTIKQNNPNLVANWKE